MPRSLAARLTATAGIAIALALAIAAATIGGVLARFVMQGLDERLDAQIALVARAVRPDGSLDRAGAADVPPFDAPGSGWAWEIVAPGGRLGSRSLGGGALPLPANWRDGPPQGSPDRAAARPRPLDGVDAAGRPLHYRLLRLRTRAGDAFAIAAAPRRIVERPLRAAMAPLLLSLVAIGALLAGALAFQLRVGLRPLGRLQSMLAEVRAGRRRHVEVDEPAELLPLVAELNALIDANAGALARARGHVANLAHGLKTPLATLLLELAVSGRDPDGRLAAEAERMDRQIRHHLGRARAAEAGPASATPLVALAPPVRDLAQAMARIHAGRGVEARLAVPEGIAVRCDPQDLDELLGNLLDNGWRYARAVVSVTAVADGRWTRIDIADDGPGMDAGEIADAVVRGRRLDEREPGHGFGLAIAGEIAELHGGTLALARAEAGGLLATIRLPAG